MLKFFLKLIIFLFLVVLSQWLLVKYDKNIYWRDIPPEVQSFKNNVLLGKKIFFFGDSVSFFPGKEGDLRTIPDFINASMSGQAVAAVTHSAYHANIFKDYISLLPRDNSCPAIVIEINLRSFSEAWEKRPEYQYEKERIFLANYDNPWFRNFWKPLAVFKFYKLDTYSQEEFRATPIIRDGNKIGTMQDFFDLERQNRLEDLRKVAFNYDYLYDLSQNNSKVRSLISIANERKTCSGKTVIYVTPIDYQSGEYYWGEKFIKRVKQNISFLEKELKKQKISLVDWSTIYPSENFMWRETNFPDEHLYSKYRADIGGRIAEILNRN